MIKDRLLKMALLKYFIHRFWYPQMEVDILSKERVSNSRKLVTDIDVLGLYPDVTGQLRTILGDCKTLKGQSPISRSLWMKGLMEYLQSDKGIIILKKNIEKDHQFTSSHMDIQLLSESDFKIYARHTSNHDIQMTSALADVESWDLFFEIEKKFPPLKDLFRYGKVDFWNESSNSSRLRHSILILKKHRQELNPSSSLQMAVCLNHISLIAIALTEIVTKSFSRYLIPESKESLDEDLKSLIWGGVENYNYLNDLRKKFSTNSSVPSNLSLPNWDSFLELMRSFLEKPMSMALLPLFLKEVAFNYLKDEQAYNYAKIISGKDSYVPGFAIRLTSYVLKATELPPEFQDAYSEKILSLTDT